MRTVNEVSRLTGVSVRALHHYDAIGLLKPEAVTEAGYRLYDDKNLERLGQILLFKELGFSLQEIGEILNSPDFDRGKVLDHQIELLNLEKKRIENIIAFAEQTRKTGVYKMNFKVFDREKIEKYAAEAKREWGGTVAYHEYEEKNAGRSEQQQNALAGGLMRIFSELGAMKDRPPEDAGVQDRVKRLQDFISANYYTCTKPILSGLGQMYAAGGEMTENIDAAGGEGTAEFVAKAISVYCG